MGYRFALLSTRFLYKHAASGMFLFLINNNAVMLQQLLKSLCNIFDTFSNEAFLQSIPPPQDNVPHVLASVLQVVHNHIAVLNEPISQSFQCFLKKILDSVLIKTTGIVEELDDDPFDKIYFSKVGAFFVTILNMKPKLFPTFIKILTEMFESSNKDISLWIANWTVIYNILNQNQKDLTKPILREANILVCKLGKTIHEIYPRKRISENNIAEEPVQSPQMQIFQRHCHAEFLKLKSCLISKITALKIVKK